MIYQKMLFISDSIEVLDIAKDLSMQYDELYTEYENLRELKYEDFVQRLHKNSYK